MTKTTSILLFKQKEIRRLWHEEDWYFSVIDVVEILTESPIPKRYWSDLKRKLSEEGSETYEKIVRLKMSASDGRQRLTDCANSKGLLRIIQSIPSPKAEPFKMWLAQVGQERLEEIENPELAQARIKKLYEQKGYPPDWIDKRLRGIAIRQNLTDEWRERGLNNQKDYAILTAEISKATFGMTPSEYKEFKNLPKQSKANLRDHMTDLELIFTMLGEKVTTEISKKEQPAAMPVHQRVAKRGGKVAGDARVAAENEIGKKVSTRENFLSGKTAKQIK